MSYNTETKFVDDEELIGKTIAKIDPPGLMAFTDGTWTHIVYDGGYYAGEGEMRFCDDLDTWTREKLIEWGIKV